MRIVSGSCPTLRERGVHGGRQGAVVGERLIPVRRSTTSRLVTRSVPTGPYSVQGKPAVVLPGGKVATSASGSGRAPGVRDAGNDGSTWDDGTWITVKEGRTICAGAFIVIRVRSCVSLFLLLSPRYLFVGRL